MQENDIFVNASYQNYVTENRETVLFYHRMKRAQNKFDGQHTDDCSIDVLGRELHLQRELWPGGG